LIVDQFEELFTQNPPDVREAFAGLLRKLVDGSDVQVLLSMRDDFLYRCHGLVSLRPIFDALMPLQQPEPEGLRRALAEPAAHFGYSFEDDELANEMVAEVEGERGALPMLAFAVARLWEQRDRKRKLLTRQAYSEIGGVTGALAHHAEATLERIGRDRLAVVRELFRNLVTAEGTRAVREWDELLSVFSDSCNEPPAEVLRHLIDARLLTSYEVREGDEAPTRRVEIVHESLLSNWPRLVGWRTQDADSVRLRDELRQAARIWDEHDRSADFLWTGKAFREYSVWRENYPGGFTDLEEDFARAMVGHARGRKRRRRATVAAAFLVLLVVLGAVGVSRQHALSESRRAEAGNLVALGHLELESNPSGAVAYATASLELADTSAARTLALAALWRGPTALVVNRQPSFRTVFSPDGSWLIQTGLGLAEGVPVRAVFADGSSEVLEQNSVSVRTWFLPQTRFLATCNLANGPFPNRVTLWSSLDRRRLAEVTYEEPVFVVRFGAGDTRLLILVVEGGVARVDALSVDGTYRRLGTPDIGTETPFYRRVAIDSASGRWLGAVVDDEVVVIEIGDTSLSEPRSLGRINDVVSDVFFDPLGRFFATADRSGEITLWDVRGDAPPTVLRGPSGLTSTLFARDGSLIAANARVAGRQPTPGGVATALAQVDLAAERGQSWIWALDAGEPKLLRQYDGLLRMLDPVGGHAAMDGRDGEVRLWSFAAPAGAAATLLRRGEVGDVWSISFHPGGSWLASADEGGIALWPLARPYPAVIRAHEDAVNGMAYDPQGRWVASGANDGTLKLWPVDSGGEVRVFGRDLGEVPGGHFRGLAASPDGGRLLAATDTGGVQMLSLDTPGGPARIDLPGFPRDAIDVAFSPDGRLAAGTSLGFTDPDERVVRIWDMASMQEVKVLGEDQPNIGHSLAFASDGGVLFATEAGLCLWDLDTGTSELVYEGRIFQFTANASSGHVLLVDTPPTGNALAGGGAVLVSLAERAVQRLEAHGNLVWTVAMDAAGELIATASLDGAIRVGKAAGGEPHLLLGHDGRVRALAVDPKGRWIVSGGEDGTVRFWPMPNLDAPPLHTLPRDELIAKLKTLTNYRAVRDERSSTGWKIDVGPFPGWETVPSW
jgi:WD40 repeat protein